jgi:hypothetical protein
MIFTLKKQSEREGSGLYAFASGQGQHGGLREFHTEALDSMKGGEIWPAEQLLPSKHGIMLY